MSAFRLSPAFCMENKAVILSDRKTEDGIYCVEVGFTESCAEKTKRKIEKAFYARHKPGLSSIAFTAITEEDLNRNIAKLYAASTGVGKMPGGTPRKEENAHSEAPIINLLNSLILECVARKASDIHIEPHRNDFLVRLRKDGELEDYTRIPPETANALVSRIKLLSQLQLVEKRRAQDGRFIFTDAGRTIEVRVSIIPAWNGESAVLRVLDTQAVPLRLDELGFRAEHVSQLEEICRMRSSLVLVCGPTGAGKTTTLAAMLSLIADGRTKVVSIEDPVEYRLDGVIQIPVNAAIGMDFDDILRRVFRHDPDVIMIGEIRDEKTAATAVRAALTGHLVLATLHASDASSGILRLLDMGIAPYLLASVFGASIAQRLVKKEGGGRRAAAEILMTDSNVVEAIRNRAALADIEKCLDKQHAVRLADDMKRPDEQTGAGK